MFFVTDSSAVYYCADGKYGILVDKRDNKVYRTIEIGQQTWMAQNLDYNDGGVVSYCYENSVENCIKYGRLYSWATALNLEEKYNTVKAANAAGTDSVLKRPAQGICPQGWHVPDSLDVNTLYEFIANANIISLNDETVSESLKSKEESAAWEYSAGVSEGTDRYGFSAVGGGYALWNTRNFRNEHTEFVAWTATEHDSTHAVRFNTYSTSQNALNQAPSGTKEYSFAVRCLKN